MSWLIDWFNNVFRRPKEVRQDQRDQDQRVSTVVRIIDEGPPLRAAIGQAVLELHQGDVTSQEVDAVMNAANHELAGGSGVDGAIHGRGGPAIMEETRRRYPQGCPTGSAVISTGGDLPAKYVLHAVGPIWRGGSQGEEELLAGAYRRGLELALEHDCQSVALPALSTGVYGYPLERASRTALSEIIAFVTELQSPRCVRFVLFHEEGYQAFHRALKEMIDRETS